MIYANMFILLIMMAGLPLAAEWRCDPALTALFTPARPQLGRFEVCTTDDPLEGDAEALEPLDAFGAAGPYDRAALQRLYGGTRVRVQRSWSASLDAAAGRNAGDPLVSHEVTPLAASAELARASFLCVVPASSACPRFLPPIVAAPGDYNFSKP